MYVTKKTVVDLNTYEHLVDLMMDQMKGSKHVVKSITQLKKTYANLGTIQLCFVTVPYFQYRHINIFIFRCTLSFHLFSGKKNSDFNSKQKACC
jgi:hypothetical protein